MSAKTLEFQIRIRPSIVQDHGSYICTLCSVVATIVVALPRITRMRRRFSAVLMQPQSLQQRSLTYINTNGDSILLMVGFESRIPGFQHLWSGGRFYPPLIVRVRAIDGGYQAKAVNWPLMLATTTSNSLQGAKCPKPSFITTLGPFHYRYALFFYHPKANPSKVAQFLTPFETC